MAITVTTSFSESNLSIQNNTSSLTVNIYFSPNNTQTWFQSATLYCRVNGTTQSKTVSLSKGGSVSTSFTFNNIAHNDDGTKSVDWSWSCSTGTSVLGDLYRSGTRALTTIPRYSDITCPSPVDMGTTQSVEITQKSDTFSHILFYKTSLDSDYTELGRGTATATYSWTLPNIATQLPNVTFDNYTLLCRTYTNANYEGEPLESTLNVQANIPSSYVPTITIDNISEGNTNVPSGWPYVVGHSKLNVRTRFTGSANSTVVSRAVKVGNETITSDNATPLVEMSFTQPLTATSNQVYASTVDSRGRTGSASQNVQAVAYASPTIAIDVTRCQQDGTIDAMGEYALVRAKWIWTDVNNLNSASIKINVDGTLATTYQTTTNSQTTWEQIAILPNILATNDYTIQAVIQDALASSQVSQTVTKATLPFSLFDDGNDIGASVGRMATGEGFRSYLNNYLLSGTQTHLLDALGTSVVETIATEKLFDYVDNATMTQAIETALNGFKKWETLWEGTCKGRETISLDVSSYSKLKVYAVSWGATLIGELDLTKTMPNNIFSGYPYCACFTGAQYVNTSKVWEIHTIMVAVNTAKNTIYNGNQGFVYNTTNELRNNNSQYYIYKVEGMK